MTQNRLHPSEFGNGNGRASGAGSPPVTMHLSDIVWSPHDFLRVIFRHKWKAGSFFLVTTTATILAVMYWPRTYVSPAKIYVGIGRESIGVDPTATAGETIQVRDSRKSEINSILEILQSRALAISVVDKLGPHGVLGRKEQNTAKRQPAWLSAALGHVKRLRERLDPVTVREKAVRAVQSSLDATTADESKMITIRYSARSPQQAQRVARQILTEYLSVHAKVHRTTGSQEFFQQQCDLQLAALQRVRQQLRDLKDEHGILTVQGRRSGLQERINWLDLTLLQTRTGKVAAGYETSVLQVESLESQAQAVIERRAELRDEMLAFSDAEMHIANLERRIAMHESNYRTYAEKLELVRIDRALIENAITNVNVVQPPAIVEKPVQPKKATLLIAGIFVAISGSLVLAYTAEFLDQSIKTPNELESVLGLPVLVSIPLRKMSTTA